MGYSVLSKYRSELMGAAMLWVMLFHAADLTFPIPVLDLFRAAGFGGWTSSSCSPPWGCPSP